MARPLRLEVPGGLYHLTSRGDRQEPIYECDEDRLDFICLLGRVSTEFNWRCHAYCLMGNHYHLLIETAEANLSMGMRQLNGVYSQHFNQRHARVGHVFQGRYKSILVERESYLLELARYIVLNPVRAGVVAAVDEWPWSSYHVMLGKVPGVPGVCTDALLARFGADRCSAIAKYRQFVAEGMGRPSPWLGLKNQIYLGCDAFVADMTRQIKSPEQLYEVPAVQRRPVPLPIAAYMRREQSRDLAIQAAYASGGYTQQQLAAYFGLHYSRISRILAKAKGKT